MLLIVDKNGNVIPAASIQFGGRILHAGNNVWRVSQAGVPLTNEYINTVTLPFTVSKDRSLTMEEATQILTATRLRFGTIWEATNEFTKDRFREVSHLVTDTNLATIDVTDWKGVSEVTVTKNLSGTVTAPEATTTRDTTRERTVTYEVPYGFALSAPASVTRSSSFDITIQSCRLDSGEYDTSFVPEGDVTIDDDCSDENDDLLPAYTSNSGWSNGAKTVSCVISGGSGADSCVITVTDPNSGRTGTITVMVETASISATTMKRMCSRSYNFEWGPYASRIYHGHGTQSLAGWQSEWNEAHNPTVSFNESSGGEGGPGVDDDVPLGAQSPAVIELMHIMGYDADEDDCYPICTITRTYLEYNVSSYIGTSNGANLEINMSSFTAKWGLHPGEWYNADSEGIALYAISSTPSGQDHEIFNNLLTQAGSGVKCSSMSVTAARLAYSDTGKLIFHIPANVINNLSDSYLRLALITKWDRDDSMWSSYPGVGNYKFPELTIRQSSTPTLKIS